MYVLLLLWKSRSIIRKEEEEEQNCTLVASRRTPSTGALESFCEFFSCMQLEYCQREPLSKFEGLSTFYCNFINVNILYCIYGTFDPFLLSYNKHMCVCACVCNGRSPEVIRPLAKCYFFLWAMATVGQREGAQ